MWLSGIIKEDCIVLYSGSMKCTPETFDIVRTTSGHTFIILHIYDGGVTLYDAECHMSYIWTAENFEKMGPYNYVGSLSKNIDESLVALGLIGGD